MQQDEIIFEDFAEQIKQRRANDNQAFEDAVKGIAGAVIGRSLADSLGDKNEIAESAIAAILKFYHAKPVNIPDEIKSIDACLDYALRPAGIMRRNVELTPGWHKDAIGAFMAVRKDDGNVVALIPKKGRYYFHDTETSKDIVVDSSNESLFEVEALCFYEPLPQEKLTADVLLKFFVQTMRPYTVINILVVTFLTTVTSALLPNMVKVLMGNAVNNPSLFISVACVMVAITISGALFGAVRTLFIGCMQQEGLTALQAAFMMRMLNLPASFFAKFGAGDLAYRVRALDTMWKSVVNVVFSSGLTVIMAVVYLLQFMRFGRTLVGPAIAIIFTILGIVIAQVIFGALYNRKFMEAASKRSEIELALLNCVQKVKLSGSESRAFAKWGERFSKELRISYNRPFFVKYGSVLVTAVSAFGSILLYWCAADAEISVANFYAFMTSYGLASGAFFQLAGVAGSIAEARSALDLLQPILDAEPEVSDNRRSLGELRGGIELSHVSFRYEESGSYILRDLNLKIEPGEYVAIVGKTGCGKSTLMRVLMGFEQPERGGVFYDGHDLASLDVGSVRRNIGIVMQDTQLLQGDIFSNIVISCPDATVEDAWEAAEIACLADDIRAMPMGMSTLLTNGGGGVSGGQRQRLAIARAIVSKPNLLFFDEATSALDNISQKKISDSLGQMGCTRIVVAHRLSTIKQCDRIVVLDEGKIVADGTFDEVYEEYLA